MTNTHRFRLCDEGKPRYNPRTKRHKCSIPCPYGNLRKLTSGEAYCLSHGMVSFEQDPEFDIHLEQYHKRIIETNIGKDNKKQLI
ncbi:MAG: hypothetical protein WC533_03025 [Candidatus Pacearchaeota archaeon]